MHRKRGAVFQEKKSICGVSESRNGLSGGNLGPNGGRYSEPQHGIKCSGDLVPPMRVRRERGTEQIRQGVQPVGDVDSLAGAVQCGPDLCLAWIAQCIGIALVSRPAAIAHPGSQGEGKRTQVLAHSECRLRGLRSDRSHER